MAAPTMLAIVYGARGVFPLMSVPAAPAPGPGQVRVRVACASVNPVDYKLPTLLPFGGWLFRGKGVGLDFSGVVESVGKDVSTFSTGQRVAGNCRGALAQYAVADVNAIAEVPAGVSLRDAASLPTAALTSLQALCKGGVGMSSNVLIFGASGGCGSAGVQIAKSMGARVVGVCSAANAAAVKELGADAVATYDDGDASLEAQLRSAGAPFDAAYDTVTSPEDKDYEGLSRRLLRPNGMHVAINGSGTDWVRALLGVPRRGHAIHMKQSSGADMAEILGLVKKGRLKAQVAEVLPFTEAGVAEAFAKLRSRRTKGKLVIRVDGAVE